MPFGNQSSLVPLDASTLLKNGMEQTRPWTTDTADALTEGVLNTYGTGTVLRSMDANNYDPVANPGRSAAAVLPRDDVISEDEWKASPQYREGVEYSPGMTPHRAQAIADQVDARKLREFYLQKRPIMSLAGGLAGGLLDPVNYVPVFGNAGAATLTGRLMLSAADAAINTGVAAGLTSGVRAELGDDTSIGEIARQMAFAAGAGAILGGAFHVLGRSARAASRAATQAEVTKGAVVMNDAVDQLSRGQDIQLSPASQDVLASMEQSIATAKETLNFAPVQSGPPDVWYHGSPVDIYATPEKGFQLVAGETGVPAVWATRDAFTAEPYSRGEMALRYDEAAGKFPLEKSYYADMSGGGVYGLRSKAKNPLEYDAGGKQWFDVPQGKVMREALANGHDAVIFKNIADNYQRSGVTSDVIAFLKPDAFEPDRIEAPPRTVDHSAPTPEPVNTGELRAAEAKVQAPVKPTFDPLKAQIEEAKALGVDPETGTHDLADEIKSFKEQNLLTDSDLAELETADREFEAAKAWGDVMEVARSCYLGK